MLLLLLPWLCLDGLVVCGAWMGFKAPQWEEPVYTNAMPRQIPSQPLLATPLAARCSAGCCRSGSASIELAIVVSSVWMQRIYFVFGFLLLMALMMHAAAALPRSSRRCRGRTSSSRREATAGWRAFANTAPPAATSSSTRSCTRGRSSSSTAPRAPVRPTRQSTESGARERSASR